MAFDVCEFYMPVSIFARIIALYIHFSRSTVLLKPPLCPKYGIQDESESVLHSSRKSFKIDNEKRLLWLLCSYQSLSQRILGICLGLRPWLCLQLRDMDLACYYNYHLRSARSKTGQTSYILVLKLLCTYFFCPLCFRCLRSATIAGYLTCSPSWMSSPERVQTLHGISVDRFVGSLAVLSSLFRPLLVEKTAVLACYFLSRAVVSREICIACSLNGSKEEFLDVVRKQHMD